MILPEHTTFRRAQTDYATSITAFFSIDLKDPSGNIVPGAMEPVQIEFTADELPVIAGIIARGRQAFCDAKN